MRARSSRAVTGSCLAAAAALGSAIFLIASGGSAATTTGTPHPLPYRAHLPAVSHDAAIDPGAERNCAIVTGDLTAPSTLGVRARLLATQDLGPSWTEVGGDGNPDDWVWFYRPARVPGEVSTAWSSYWEKGSAGLDERISAYESAARASELFAEVPRTQGCIVANINAGKANSAAKGWTFANARSEYITFPAMGVGTLAYRLTYDYGCGPGCGETDTQFRVYVLTGKYIVAVHLDGYNTGEGLPIPAAEFEAIVARAVERASQ